jgi:hypothetical protein
MAIYFILFQASLSTIEDTEAWISSMDLPLVSGTSIATNTNDKTTNPKKMRNKTDADRISINGRNSSETKKLQVQLTVVAAEFALARTARG